MTQDQVRQLLESLYTNSEIDRVDVNIEAKEIYLQVSGFQLDTEDIKSCKEILKATECDTTDSWGGCESCDYGSGGNYTFKNCEVLE